MTPHILIPLTEIDAEALPRDRTQLDEDAMAELSTSIATSGLRMPIEVWKLSQPTETHRYGLISGLRRLTAHQRLATSRQNGSFTEIAAFLRTPETIPQAMADMVTENEIRAETSAWEKGATLLAATRAGIFDTLDDATQVLHASASRQNAPACAPSPRLSKTWKTLSPPPNASRAAKCTASAPPCARACPS